MVIFWILVILTTIAFLGAGITKLVVRKDRLIGMHMNWVEDFNAGTVRLIATAEVVGALGVLLPVVTIVAPVLTPIAALCLALLMLGAVGTHLRRKEAPYIPLVLALLAAATCGVTAAAIL